MSKGDSQIPKLEEMIVLYRTCMNLTRDSELLLNATSSLKNLTLNAEVHAARVGEKGRVFQSISRETNQLSIDITVILQQLIDNVNSISIQAIESAGRARLCEKYQRALEIGVHSSTRENVVSRQAVMADRIKQALSKVFVSLKNTYSMMGEMEQLYRRLPVIAMQMKIEANRENEFKDVFDGLAQDILDLNIELKSAIMSIRKKTSDSIERFGHIETGVHT